MPSGTSRNAEKYLGEDRSVEGQQGLRGGAAHLAKVKEGWKQR